MAALWRQPQGVCRPSSASGIKPELRAEYCEADSVAMPKVEKDHIPAFHEMLAM
jgi:hypothetical protein